jgi:hypothetical protein
MTPSSRRDFLAGLAGAGLALPLLSERAFAQLSRANLVAGDRTASALADDESYWSQIQRAFDGLTQKDWNDAVKSALGSATGMQALTRLLDRVQGTAGQDEVDDVTLSPAERAAILSRFAARAEEAGAGGDPLSPSTSDHVGDDEETGGGT